MITVDRGDPQLGVELDAPRRARRPLGAALAVAFFLVGLVGLDDYGITWDENVSYLAGLRNLEMVRGVLLGYQFVFDALRALFTTQANALFFEPGSLLAASTPLLFLITASIGAFQIRPRAAGRCLAQLALLWVAICAPQRSETWTGNWTGRSFPTDSTTPRLRTTRSSA